MTEDLISGLVREVTGSYVIQYSADEGGEPMTIDFSPPWRRVSMMSGLEEVMGEKFPSLESPDARTYFDNLCVSRGVECGSPRTLARLIDKLVGHYLETQFVNPTFITDHPELMSPLAKSHRNIPGLTERFELFVAHRELCNAYTELNMPVVQRQRFEEQAKQSAAGDDEAQVIATSQSLLHNPWVLALRRLDNYKMLLSVITLASTRPNIELVVISRPSI
jgi:lysyl-tRNA synthetase, class II